MSREVWIIVKAKARKVRMEEVKRGEEKGQRIEKERRKKKKKKPKTEKEAKKLVPEKFYK